MMFHHLLLSLQCVQDLLQQDLRILICFASCVVSSVDGAQRRASEAAYLNHHAIVVVIVVDQQEEEG